MKYFLSAIKENQNSQLLLENVVPARTGHIKGYGSGVTFTSGASKWSQSATFASIKLLKFAEPTIVTQ